MTIADTIATHTAVVPFENTFAELFGEAFDLLVERQRKYGPNNIARLGIHGVMSRLLHDKGERIMRQLNGRVVNGQIVIDIDLSAGEAGNTFEDACLDVANYALIALSLARGTWGRPLRDDLDQPEGRLLLAVGDFDEGQPVERSLAERIADVLEVHGSLTAVGIAPFVGVDRPDNLLPTLYANPMFAFTPGTDEWSLRDVPSDGQDDDHHEAEAGGQS